jgi:predicted metal-dependent enzyme (double-stranded beta helix superfamily)
MRSLAEALKPAIRGLDEISRSALDSHSTVKAVVPLVAALVAADDWLPAEARRVVREKNYAVHAVYLDPDDRFSILSVVWKPLADTPIHDHVVWGVSGQLQGTLVETNFQRIADDARPSGGRMESTGEFTATPGVVTWVVAPDDIHLARNVSKDPAIAIQVYGGNFTNVSGRYRYEADGALVPTRTIYDSVAGARA